MDQRAYTEEHKMPFCLPSLAIPGGTNSLFNLFFLTRKGVEDRLRIINGDGTGPPDCGGSCSRRGYTDFASDGIPGFMDEGAEARYSCKRSHSLDCGGPTLRRILNFLSGDRWIVDFWGRPEKFRQCVMSMSQ
jgi:hypothetical protein